MGYFLILIGTLLTCACAIPVGTRYIDSISDFTQSDVQGESFGNGNQFCGPVAVSNSIVWLANKKNEQLEIIKRLASKPYMNTSLKNGTGTEGMLNGTDRIAKELFGEYKSLSYQGWRTHQQKFSTGIKQPQMDWLKSGISDRSSVWLNIGWYRKSSSSSYSRIGGHWVTLVGFEGENTLILHDPSPRAGNTFSNEFVTTVRLSAGTLNGNNQEGLPISAVGFFSLTHGMHIKPEADIAIIDGGIILKL